MTVYDIVLGVLVLVSVVVHTSHHSRLKYLRSRIKELEDDPAEDRRSLRKLAREAVDKVDANFVDNMKQRYDRGLPQSIRNEAQQRAVGEMAELIEQSTEHDAAEIDEERMEILVDEEVRNKRNQ